nr:alpha/beta hydrolase fold domain-containing protein [Caldimonas mangrovi]
MHPDLEAFLDLVAAAGRDPMHRQPLAIARAEYDRAARDLDDTTDAVAEIRHCAVPCRDSATVAARLYLPQQPQRGAGLPVLLYFHGGGYTVGGLDSHDGLCRALCARTPCAVLSVAYRLAPEHKFPTACNDAEDAYLWLLEHGRALGLDTRRIATGGDSAGGTLATALALMARDATWPKPRAQVLLYPCTSASQDTASHRRYASGYLLEGDTLQWMYAHYLRNDDDREDRRFAPLEAPDLRGLPAAFVGLAEHDVLLDEGLGYAERLKAAGVPTTVVVYEGMVHDFARLANVVPEAAQRVRSEMAAFLARAFTRCD